VFGLGQWDTAEWTVDITLAEMLLAVIHAPDEAVRAARLEALASQRLFVSMPRKSPRVRAVLAALCRAPEGQLVYHEAVAVRVPWTVSRPAHAAAFSFARIACGVQWS
jgi:hypothetical protein